jgi:hypothetical protein
MYIHRKTSSVGNEEPEVCAMIHDYVFLTHHSMPRPYEQSCYLNLPHSIVTSCMKTLNAERKNYANFGSKLIALCHVITSV